MSHQTKHLYGFGHFRLDAGERLLLREGESVPLTPKAFDLLLALVEHHGHLLGKDELMKRVWPDTIVEEANLSYNISLIRKALGDRENGQKYIETVPKRGYRFVAEVREVGAEQEQVTEAAARYAIGGTRPESLISKVKRHRKGALLSLAVLVVAFGGIAFGLYKFTTRSESESSDAPEVIPLTSLPGQEFQPAFSPDGNQIAFVWRKDEDSGSDIYIKLANHETSRQLTKSPADELSPAWSPDGNFIAFLRRSQEGNGVYVVTVLGGAERKIGTVLRDVPWTHSLNWSPDGSSLLIEDKVSPQEPLGIFLLSVETGLKQRLTSPPSGVYGDFNAAYSPDGKAIAFSRVTSWNAADIYLVPAAGGEVRRLTRLGRDINGFAWTAAGAEIIFSSSTSRESNVLMKVSVLQGATERLDKLERGIINPAISRQGNRLAYTKFMEDTNIWRLDLSDSSKDQSDAPFIASTRLDLEARYSPDGRKIAFTSNRSGTFQIWVCDSDGSNPRQLTDLASANGDPNWSPDSRYISFDTRVRGNADIFVISAEGGQPRALTSEPSDDVTSSWSRDGRWIYFSSKRSGRMQLWKVPVGGRTGGAGDKGGRLHGLRVG